MTVGSMVAERFRIWRGALFAAVVLLRGVEATPCAADEPSAASLFDDAVQSFQRSEYERAAELFLRADAARPSAQALVNAIVAARKAHAHLLAARAAERAIERKDADAELLRTAREALAEASAHLVRVELSCVVEGTSTASCGLSIDGEKMSGTTRYLLPGTHRFTAQAGSSRDEKSLTCEAGATYTIALRPSSSAPIASSSAAATSGPPASTSRGWPPAVAYAGAGLTAALIGVTVWSGVDALDGKSALIASPSEKGRDDVLARAHRTDVLLAGSVVVAAATVVAGVWLVDWGAPSRPSASVGVSASPGGAFALVKGGF